MFKIDEFSTKNREAGRKYVNKSTDRWPPTGGGENWVTFPANLV